MQQSAFLPERLIIDNARVSFEIFHAMKMKGEGKEGSITLKLDMEKACDGVEWIFLEKVMYKLGFGDKWVKKNYGLAYLVFLLHSRLTDRFLGMLLHLEVYAMVILSPPIYLLLLMLFHR